MASIAILGGGVSGVTTGLVLRLLGHDTCLYTAQRADVMQGQHAPRFASLYPAASVLPHTVQLAHVARHMRVTQRFFEVLRQSGTSGVRLQRHVEAFESPQPDPPYAPAMRDFERLPPDGRGAPGLPSRPGAEAVFGWRVRCYFAETPTYLPRLYALYDAAGGAVTSQTLTRETLHALPEDVWVNALGASGPDLFDDPRPATVLRGCLVHVDPPGPMPPDSAVQSYNYTPSPEVYPTAEGAPGGLYVYPRTDAWVLGGSKRPGAFDAAGRWTGPPLAASSRTIDGVEVPAPVLDVNAALIGDLFGVDLRDQPMRATFGYRFARDLDGDGVRLDTSTVDGRLVVHNYGHGGAGVTLSWSCAVAVAQQIAAAAVSPGPSPSCASAAPPPDRWLLQHLATCAHGAVVEGPDLRPPAASGA